MVEMVLRVFLDQDERLVSISVSPIRVLELPYNHTFHQDILVVRGVVTVVCYVSNEGFFMVVGNRKALFMVAVIVNLSRYAIRDTKEVIIYLNNWSGINI